MKLHSLLLSLLLLSLFAAASSRSEPLIGGWRPIKNLTDPHIKEIGEFAVSAHNKESKTGLTFKKVVRGETQVVAGINYRLVVAVTDGSAKKYYQAVVWEKPWEKFMNLTSFVPVKR